MDEISCLPEDAFEGHEFILIKPTEKLPSLTRICDEVLEDADDVFEKIPGFGQDHIETKWLIQSQNQNKPICLKIREHFGWTKLHEITALEGYRHSENAFVYMLMHDECFIDNPRLQASYYGDSLFPHVRNDKNARGNVLMWKLMIKNKKRVPLDNSTARMVFLMSDGDDLNFEYEIAPVTKFEVALMLQQRREAIARGKFTRRQCELIRAGRSAESRLKPKEH